VVFVLEVREPESFSSSEDPFVSDVYNIVVF
jgi:hypothetical protein